MPFSGKTDVPVKTSKLLFLRLTFEKNKQVAERHEVLRFKIQIVHHELVETISEDKGFEHLFFSVFLNTLFHQPRVGIAVARLRSSLFDTCSPHLLAGRQSSILFST